MNKQKVTIYGNDHKETHEIYAVFASKDKRLLYVGEGLKDRHKHTFSGHSHVKALNTIHKREVPITVEVFGVKAECQDRFPEWFQIIDALGMETVRKNSFRKGTLKKAYDSLITVNSAPLEVRIAKSFKVGEKYSSKEIKDILTRLNIPKAKAVFIKKWFEVKEVQVFKERGYRIIRKL